MSPSFIRSIVCCGAAVALILAPLAVNAATYTGGAWSISAPVEDVTYINANTTNNSSVGTRTTTVGPGFLDSKWDQGGVWKEYPNQISNKRTFGWSGSLSVQGGMFTNSAGATITHADVSKSTSQPYAFFNNHGQIDFLNVHDGGMITNTGRIGIASTAQNDRTGGITQDGGYVYNTEYVSRLLMSGGMFQNDRRVSYVDMSGGTLNSTDYIVYAKVSGNAELNNNRYFSTEKNRWTGGGIDRLEQEGGTVNNTNFVRFLDLSGGTFNNTYTEERPRVLQEATIRGGTFQGDGLVGSMILATGGTLDTNLFTGVVSDLSFSGGTLLFSVNDLADFSMLRLLGVQDTEGIKSDVAGTVDWYNSIVEVNFNSSWFKSGDWEFDLADLFDFGENFDYDEFIASMDWDSFGIYGLEGLDWDLDGSVITLNSEFTGPAGEPVVANPEPATLLLFGLATLCGVPAVKRMRRKSA